jgi:hypothetical protein
MFCIDDWRSSCFTKAVEFVGMVGTQQYGKIVFFVVVKEKISFSGRKGPQLLSAEVGTVMSDITAILDNINLVDLIRDEQPLQTTPLQHEKDCYHHKYSHAYLPPCTL